MLPTSNKPLAANISQNRIISEQNNIRLIIYNKQDCVEKQVLDWNEIVSSNYTDTDTLYWIDIIGLHQIEAIRAIGNLFGVDAVVLDDLFATEQRPKLQDFDDYLYLILRDLWYNEKNETIEVEQLSFIAGHNYIISIQEREGDVFEEVRAKLRNTNSKRTTKTDRNYTADYLLYSLIDAIIDNFFLILEQLDEEVEEIEDNLLKDIGDETLVQIYHLRKQSIVLKRAVTPMREIISKLVRESYYQSNNDSRWLLQEIYNHCVEVIENVESCRDSVADLVDLYMSNISNRMNGVMKVLAVISTIFIPLTFIAGVYGMNFEYMPELHWHYGYYTVWIVMVLLVASMVGYFRYKKWL